MLIGIVASRHPSRVNRQALSEDRADDFPIVPFRARISVSGRKLRYAVLRIPVHGTAQPPTPSPLAHSGDSPAPAGFR